MHAALLQFPRHDHSQKPAMQSFKQHPSLELLEGVALSLEEQEGQEEVSDEDQHQADDHSRCGTLSYSLGSTCRRVTP